MRTWTGPSSVLIPAKARATDSGEATSHSNPVVPSISFSSALRVLRVLASIATAYPAAAKRLAMAAPLPGPTPATTATFLSFVIASASRVERHDSSNWYSAGSLWSREGGSASVRAECFAKLPKLILHLFCVGDQLALGARSFGACRFDE